MEIEEGQRIIVGVKKFANDENRHSRYIGPAPKVVREAGRRLEKPRRARDNNTVQHCLAKIHKAAQGKDNLVPFILDAVKNYATVGEVCGVLRHVFGEYKPPAFEIEL